MDQDEQKIKIKFEEEEEGWRVADLIPGEGCIHNGIVYIKLGFGDVVLQTYDEYRMTPGEDGVNKKKQFFFRPDTACITTLQGETVIAPVAIEVIVKWKGFGQGPGETIFSKSKLETTRDFQLPELDEDEAPELGEDPPF